jgi:hypothetical protein
MKSASTRQQLMLTAALLGALPAFAGTDVRFTPLTGSAPVGPPNSLGETASPFVTPEGIHQTNIVSLRVIEDQDYISGKDPLLFPPANVYDRIDNETSPTLPQDRLFRWNILLDWPGK